MATTRKVKSQGSAPLLHLRDALVLEARTPGSLGVNDAGDPSRLSLLGDTPGPTGVKFGLPEDFVLPGLQTYHDSLDEARGHIPAGKQCRCPASLEGEVLSQACDFISREEGFDPHPYVPTQNGEVIENSGITIGYGYDLGQHSVEEIDDDWDRPGVDQALLDSLEGAALLTGTNAQDRFRDYGFQNITITENLALEVLKSTLENTYYPRAQKFFPGLTNLPTGVQVAIISLVYQGGAITKKELACAVKKGDLVGIINWYFESMRRSEGYAGLVKRRKDEANLILPYVAFDLMLEATTQLQRRL